ncbi:hypothetical protein T492DRAFT_905881 [Pavlovales sp. CCMP2436]|nr:hypothetical protein T492DRAFT_905881 [Pavlovales sp. CCMP2436]
MLEHLRAILHAKEDLLRKALAHLTALAFKFHDEDYSTLLLPDVLVEALGADPAPDEGARKGGSWQDAGSGAPLPSRAPFFGAHYPAGTCAAAGDAGDYGGGGLGCGPSGAAAAGAAGYSAPQGEVYASACAGGELPAGAQPPAGVKAEPAYIECEWRAAYGVVGRTQHSSWRPLPRTCRGEMDGATTARHLGVAAGARAAAVAGAVAGAAAAIGATAAIGAEARTNVAPKAGGAQDGNSTRTIKTRLSSIMRDDHLPYFRRMAVKADLITKLALDVGGGFAKAELPYWRTVVFAVTTTPGRHGKPAVLNDLPGLAEFSAAHPSVRQVRGPVPVEHFSNPSTFIARKIATTFVGHVLDVGLYDSVHALVRKAAACNLLDDADSDGMDEDEVPRPSPDELKFARQDLTRILWRGELNNPRLPVALRGPTVRALLPQFSTVTGHNIGYYLGRRENRREAVLAMLRILGAAEDTAGGRVGPKIFPKKGSLICGHWLCIDSKYIRDVLFTSTKLHNLLGASRKERMRAIDVVRPRLFELVFDMKVRELRQGEDPDGRHFSSVETDGQSASISVAYDVELEDPGRKDYLSPEMLRDYPPENVISFDFGKGRLISAYGTPLPGQLRPRTLNWTAHNHRRLTGMPRARTIEQLEATLGVRARPDEEDGEEEDEAMPQAMDDDERERTYFRLRRAFSYPWFRNHRLRAFGGSKRVYGAMVDAFEQRFRVQPGQGVIALGDWSCHHFYPKHGKWHQRSVIPIATMEVLRVFRRRGHIIGFVDESWTSQDYSRPCCFAHATCDAEWKLARRMKRKGRTRVPRFVKALTRCMRCRTIFQRDFNGARNIRRRALHIRGQPSPPAPAPSSDGTP